MNISLRQMKAFLEIARLKSFTRAAEHLHITQQGLSLMIRDLETQLNCRLFDRTTRAVALTTAGKQFLPAVEQSVLVLETASATLGQMTAKARHTLSVAATPLVAATLMPEAKAMFQARHPNVTVRISDVGRKHIQALVESGEVDVGFGVFFKPSAGLDRKQIFNCDLICISASTCRKRSARSAISPVQRLTWADLGNRPLLGLPYDNPVQQLVDSHLAKISRGNEERLTFNNFQTLLGMVEAGFGTAILPSFAVSAVRRMKIDIALLSNPVVPVNFFQINQKGRARSATEPDFVLSLLKTMETRCSLKMESNPL